MTLGVIVQVCVEENARKHTVTEDTIVNMEVCVWREGGGARHEEHSGALT